MQWLVRLIDRLRGRERADLPALVGPEVIEGEAIEPPSPELLAALDELHRDDNPDTRHTFYKHLARATLLVLSPEALKRNGPTRFAPGERLDLALVDGGDGVQYVLALLDLQQVLRFTHNRLFGFFPVPTYELLDLVQDDDVGLLIEHDGRRLRVSAEDCADLLRYGE